MFKDHMRLKIDLISQQQNNTIHIPAKELPKSFSHDTQDFFCGGYFVGYDCSYTPKELADFFVKKQTVMLANKSADFIIIFIYTRTKEVFVLTGQSGRFPCFFTVRDTVLYLSTNFVWVKKQLQKPSLDLDFVFHHLYSNNVSLLTDQTLFNEIKQVPPATLFAMQADGSFILTPLITIENFLPKENKY